MKNAVDRSAVSEFWKWFSDNSSNLSEDLDSRQESAIFLIREKLHLINPQLAFQVSNILPDGRREFVLSADGYRELFPVVINIAEAAPELKDWKIIAFRPAVKGEIGIEMNGVSVNKSDIFVKHRCTSALVDVELHIRGYNGTPEMQSAAFLLLDCTLGEYVTETFIGKLEFYLLSEKQIFNLIPLEAFLDTITQFIQERAN